MCLDRDRLADFARDHGFSSLTHAARLMLLGENFSGRA